MDVITQRTEGLPWYMRSMADTNVWLADFFPIIFELYGCFFLLVCFGEAR